MANSRVLISLPSSPSSSSSKDPSRILLLFHPFCSGYGFTESLLESTNETKNLPILQMWKSWLRKVKSRVWEMT